MIRVCVVGAGAAGLCAARHLVEDPGKFQVTVFEQQATIGGTWRYTDKVGVDDYGQSVHSSMYKNLKTNLPIQVMAFPDYPFQRQKTSFVSHDVILDYLQDYASNFDLLQHIKFLRKVNKIRLSSPASCKDTWLVDVTQIESKVTETLEFDAVMICVGSFSKPKVPDILGIESFPGEILHSHDYRAPDAFAGKNVVVLGAASSGVDIAIEVSAVARCVIMSHNNNLIFNQKTCPPRLTEKPGIVSIRNDVVTFKNGDIVHADVILFCTGYHLTAPDLLDANVGLVQNDRRIPTLYKHLIHVPHPTLAILGVPLFFVPFPVYNLQVLFLLSIWTSETNLPCPDEMLEDIESSFQKRLAMGFPVRYAHSLKGDLMWELVKEMQDMAPIKKLPAYYEELYRVVRERRGLQPQLYKKDEYVLLEDGRVQHFSYN